MGSRISLISKAKIRYEGILHSIDTEQATVALSKVQSFGTEERVSDRFIPLREDIYEYIIFRGTDIDDLIVCEPPSATFPQDPAIIQSMASQSSTNDIQRFEHHTTFNESIAFDSKSSAHHHQVPQESSQKNDGDKAKNEAAVTGVRNQNNSQKIINHKKNHDSNEKNANNESATSRSLNREQTNYRSTNSTRRSGNNFESRSGYRNNGQRSSNYAATKAPNHRHCNYQQAGDDDVERNSNSARYYPAPQRGGPRRFYRGSGDAVYRGSRGRGRRYTSRSKDSITFEKDFDFEQSNAQFNKEDIAKELKDKLKIDGNNDKPKENFDKNLMKSDGNCDEQREKTASKNNEDDEDLDDTCYYDKSKSFFDNITCETTNPKGERMSWVEERKKNTETFGSTWNGGRGGRGYRGRGYRGRRGGPGGYRGRSYGNGFYRGNSRGYYGYNSNYRSRRDYHDRNEKSANHEEGSRRGGTSGGGVYYHNRWYNKKEETSSENKNHQKDAKKTTA